MVASAAIKGAAKAASVDSPMTGFAAASPSPRAAAMPTRRPVKLPGPVGTAKRSICEKSSLLAAMTRAISGIKASAWPRAIGIDSCATMAPCPVSSTAAEQASSAVSMAKTRMTVFDAPFAAGSNRPNLGDFRHEMLEQVLDAVLQRRGRGRTARAGALHLQEHDAFFVALEGDVAAVAGHRRPYARLDQVLD